MSGRLVSLEGGEGAGKSTVIAAMEAFLVERGVEYVRSREPGGTPMGERIRELLLDAGGTGMDARTELLLMFASRAQLVRELVEPSLAAGRWVLCDRFTDASFAYQGGGRGLDGSLIAELERQVVGRRPDLTLLLDVPVEVGLERARGRAAAPDRIESESEAFFERVRSAYRRRAAAEPDRFVVIDASAPLEQVVQAARAALEALWQRSH
ncbi:dTMP kinase [Pseudomarimonas salicorniae]|uniref:Thymidylate kinase n=1 Tax=Pseudomarimonas salicorniae TaxID=2933270 RepID=A0ABT0GJK1_9GAMM|nr:dTMP kinase [Lysobacter sp. CAU 1642]MCK7594727.1 dTMP kinase [Lysobacter sp. CAU 1642]